VESTLLLEYALFRKHCSPEHFHDQNFSKILSEIQKNTGLEMSVSGVKAKKSKFQEKEIPTLVLFAASGTHCDITTGSLHLASLLKESAQPFLIPVPIPNLDPENGLFEIPQISSDVPKNDMVKLSSCLLPVDQALLLAFRYLHTI
jgi:hypothetical protein